jgi:hypothetical protein
VIYSQYHSYSFVGDRASQDVKWEELSVHGRSFIDYPDEALGARSPASLEHDCSLISKPDGALEARSRARLFLYQQAR